MGLGTTYNLDSTKTVDTSNFSSGFPASALMLSTEADGIKVITLSMQVVGMTPGNILAVELVIGPGGPGGFGSQYWQFPLIKPADFAPTQFPTITDNTNPMTPIQQIAFPSHRNRLYLYGK